MAGVPAWASVSIRPGVSTGAQIAAEIAEGLMRGRASAIGGQIGGKRVASLIGHLTEEIAHRGVSARSARCGSAGMLGHAGSAPRVPPHAQPSRCPVRFYRYQ
eukprot:541264-Pyramimonas_sp.AAC.1